MYKLKSAFYHLAFKRSITAEEYEALNAYDKTKYYQSNVADISDSPEPPTNSQENQSMVFADVSDDSPSSESESSTSSEDGSSVDFGGGDGGGGVADSDY